MSRCRLCNTTSIRPFRSLPNQPAQFLNNLETFGAEGGIVSEGVAQVIDGLGNPLVIPGDPIHSASVVLYAFLPDLLPFLTLY